MLQIKPRQAVDFEATSAAAHSIISSMPGYVSHELQRCPEYLHQYSLLVRWQTLEDHTLGLRQSPLYQQWRELLHHFYDPFPAVEHYAVVTAENGLQAVAMVKHELNAIDARRCRKEVVDVG